MGKLTLLGVLIAAGACAITLSAPDACAQQQPADGTPSQAEAIAALQAEIERLRAVQPAQAVAMTVVEYNFTNLWFAAHEKNWPLATFFLSETRARLRWALRISPERRVSTGTIALQPYLDAFEQAPYAALAAALESHDIRAFEAAYEQGLGGCQSCHAASEKAYLRFRAPSAPAIHLIDFAPE